MRATGSGRSRGYRAERELVATLWRMGFAVMRAPASGSKIKRADYPDVVAIRKGKVAVFEVKSRRKYENIYLSRTQVRKLINFTERAGGKAFIAIRIPHEGWRVVPVENLELMGNGNYRLSKEVIEKAPNLTEVLKQLGFIATLDQYTKGRSK